MTWTRRQALRSAAATLWLPFLPSVARGASLDAPPRRLAVWFLPHGMQDVHVAPSGSGLETTTVTEPITTLPGRISLVSGMNNPNGNGSHGRATASLLTDAPAGYGELVADISVDQVAAAHYRQQVPFPSLQLAIDAPGLFNSNEGILSSRISWSGPSVPLAPAVGPRATYNLLFQGTDTKLSEKEAERRRQLRHSVLDAVKDRIGNLQPKLSASDRVRLDQYTTGIRELERRIDGLADRRCDTVTVPGLEPTYMESVRLMAELQKIAFACDLTRVITFMYGPSGSDITLPEIGITAGSHQISHAWSYDEASDADFQQMNRWHIEQYVEFCRSLGQTTELDDSDLLDHTAVVIASEFSNAAYHYTDKMAMLVAGGEASGMRPGRHINARGVPHANLLRSLLRHMAVPSPGFGRNATGTLAL